MARIGQQSRRPRTDARTREPRRNDGCGVEHDSRVDRDAAAVFDPFGNAVHTALTFDVLGEDVLITGAGPIGIMAAAVARHAGARYIVITDVNDYRLELAKKVRVDMALNIRQTSITDAQKKLGMKEGFDVAMEMSGNASAFRDMPLPFTSVFRDTSSASVTTMA